MCTATNFKNPLSHQSTMINGLTLIQCFIHIHHTSSAFYLNASEERNLALVSRPRMFGLQTGGARVRTIEPALPPDLQPLVNEGSQESCFLLQTFSQWTKTN